MLVMGAKSPWNPAIRREHFLAREAAAQGVRATFIERPADLRDAAKSSPLFWARGIGGCERSPAADEPARDVRVLRRATLAPGHRGRVAAAVDNVGLARAIARAVREADGDETIVAAQVPWQWPAVLRRGSRRVFDCADDWTALIPARAPRLAELYRRIAAEADAVIVASPELDRLFPGRKTHVVPNGVEARMIGGDSVESRRERALVYVGTLSERVDLALLGEVLDLLPGWTLDLYGQCQYAGLGTHPSAELAGFLVGHAGATWHGPVSRETVAEVIDSATVCVAPHRAEFAVGQSSMKMLDYAARGRPVVSTRTDDAAQLALPPGVWVVADAAAFAAAVLEAAAATGDAEKQLAWARERLWKVRWQEWLAVAS